MPWRRNLRVVLFDIDDTLTDYRAIVNQAMGEVHEALAGLGFPVERADFLAHFWAIKGGVERQGEQVGWSVQEVRRRWMRATLDACGTPDLAHPDDLATLYAEVRDRTIVYQPDAAAAVARLRGAFRLGIVSGGATRPDVFDLGRHFDDMLFSYQAGLWKPDPAVFALALERLECAPEQAVYVGDDPERDVIGALIAGLRAIWFNPTGRAFPEGAPPADFEAANLGAVADFLLAGRDVE